MTTPTPASRPDTAALRDHVRMLAILNIVFGALGMLVAVLVLVLFGGIAAIVGASADAPDAHVAMSVLTLVGGFVFVLLSVLSIPEILAGIGLLQRRSWGRVVAIVVSALNLLNIPFGTLVGGYGLWVLLQPGVETLFEASPTPPAVR